MKCSMNSDKPISADVSRNSTNCFFSVSISCFTHLEYFNMFNIYITPVQAANMQLLWVQVDDPMARCKKPRCCGSHQVPPATRHRSPDTRGLGLLMGDQSPEAQRKRRCSPPVDQQQNHDWNLAIIDEAMGFKHHKDGFTLWLFKSLPWQITIFNR